MVWTGGRRSLEPGPSAASRPSRAGRTLQRLYCIPGSGGAPPAIPPGKVGGAAPPARMKGKGGAGGKCVSGFGRLARATVWPKKLPPHTRQGEQLLTKMREAWYWEALGFRKDG